MRPYSRKKSFIFIVVWYLKWKTAVLRRVFASKTLFRKSSFTEKLQRVLTLLRYQTKEEGMVNKREKKNSGKISSYYEFEATEATLCPVLAQFFLNFCILFGESLRREISDWFGDTELFILFPTALVSIFAELGLGCYLVLKTNCHYQI